MQLIAQAIREHARERPDAPAIGWYEDGAWTTATWREYWESIRRVGRALLALGVEPGQAVGILGFNRPEWAEVAQAAMAVGAVPTGIYTTSSPEEVAYVLGHCDAPVVVVENQAQLAKVAAVRERLPALRHAVVMRGEHGSLEPWSMRWEAFEASAGGASDADFDAALDALQPDQLAVLIYTSGTTGPPKGVMLTHGNVAWTARCAIEQLVPAAPGDRVVSYLPLSHIAEQMFTLHGHAVGGYTVYFARSLDTLREDMQAVRPTVFFGVPRVWERMREGVLLELSKAPPQRRRIAQWAMSVGWRAIEPTLMGGAAPAGIRLAHAVADRLVLSKVRAALGLDAARVCVSGAAPIGIEVLEFFASIGLVVHEVYGQSEDCGPTSFNRIGRTRFGTVGEPLPGVDVRIASDGEILVRGPNVFAGYYRDEAATADTLRDGWLYSGDLGVLDADGFLHITGRKKDILITAGGKNVSPALIEEKLRALPLVAQAVVVGDRRKYLTALVALDPEAVRTWAEQRGVDAAAAVGHPDLVAELDAGIQQVNETLARVEQIKKYRILPQPLTIASGELTPTLKVRRARVIARYADLIESMYS